MHSPRLITTLLATAALLLALASGVLAQDERTCTWVGGTEVCIPPR